MDETHDLNDANALAAAALFVAWFDRQVASGAIPPAEVRATWQAASDLLLEGWRHFSPLDRTQVALGTLDGWAHRWLGPRSPGDEPPPL